MEREAQAQNGKPRKPGLPNGRLGALLRMVMVGACIFDTVGKLMLPVETEGLDTWVARSVFTGERATPGTPASLPTISKEEGITIFGGEVFTCGALVLA